MDCTHLYCASCIRDFLNTMLEEGVSPVCPSCHDNAHTEQPPEGGRVDEKALALLERSGVIDNALRVRITWLQQREEGALLFPCPAPGCSHLLVQTKPELTLHASKGCRSHRPVPLWSRCMHGVSPGCCKRRLYNARVSSGHCRRQQRRGVSVADAEHRQKVSSMLHVHHEEWRL